MGVDHPPSRLKRPANAVHTAQGTRLNRRGLKTRRHIIDTAVACLAAEGTDAASANYIARRAGTTWGTIQHQFGGVDGLWAAILEDVGAKMVGRLQGLKGAEVSVAERVTGIVDAIWELFDEPANLATQSLRNSLPRAPETLALEFPATTKALLFLDGEWQHAWTEIFSGLPISAEKIRGVRQLLPGAIRGLHAESRLTTFIDVREGLTALAAAIVAYLSLPPLKFD